MCKRTKIAYDILIKNYRTIIHYAAKTSDSFSVVTEQVKPFSIVPPKCKHDEILNSIADYLIKQVVGVKSWPGTKTSANHMVLNIYRMAKSTRNWLNESPNLLYIEKICRRIFAFTVMKKCGCMSQPMNVIWL